MQTNEITKPPAEQAAKPDSASNGIQEKQKPKIEERSVKHTFNPEERNLMGGELARSVGSKRQIEAELDGIKASFKAKITEADARIDKISTDLVNGFEMRTKRCQVHFFPAERKKRLWLENDDIKRVPFIAEEEMTREDYQQDLLQADGKFDRRVNVELFKQAGLDQGFIVVGCLGKFWYAANRVSIGKHKLEERLDSEQPAAKKRIDAIKQAADRYWSWLSSTLGKDNAKGFEAEMKKAIDSQKERTE